MAGLGPVPKRSEERRRRSQPEGPTLVRIVSESEPVVPDADPEWHPLARGWWEALAASAQTRFYEPSDYAAAYLVAEAVDRLLRSDTFSGTLFTAIMNQMGDLLVTEGARRRLRVELTRKDDGAELEQPAATAMAAYRKAAS